MLFAVHPNMITRHDTRTQTHAYIKLYQESYAENWLEIIEWFYGAALYGHECPEMRIISAGNFYGYRVTRATVTASEIYL